MRKFKTSEKGRTNYIYYTAEGKKITLTPGMIAGQGQEITEELIAILHSFDDDEVDANRRDEYHCPVHYQSYTDGSGEDADDRNDYLADKSADPLALILNEMDDQERSDRLDRLEAALSSLTESQKSTICKKFYRKMTNVAIAAEEGVSEAAIRNRLKKIYEKLKKKI